MGSKDRKLAVVTGSIKRKDTPESRKYWQHVEKIAAEVRKWPKWKQDYLRAMLDPATY